MIPEGKTEKRKPLHFGWVLLLSFGIFHLGPLVDQTVRWSDHLRGFMNGVFHIIFYTFGWGIYLLPWSLIVYGLYRWRKWKRFRTAWTIAPAFLVWVLVIIGFVSDPPTSKGAFEKLITRPLPESVKNLNVYRSGGGVADYTYLFYFEIDPEDFDKVLSSRAFERLELSVNDMWMFQSSGANSSRPVYKRLLGDVSDLPSPHDWEEAEIYEIYTENRLWRYRILTDKTHRQVYFEAGCI
mgnify:CR=1 FL=1